MSQSGLPCDCRSIGALRSSLALVGDARTSQKPKLRWRHTKVREPKLFTSLNKTLWATLIRSLGFSALFSFHYFCNSSHLVGSIVLPSTISLNRHSKLPLSSVQELYEGKVNQAGREGSTATEADIKSVAVAPQSDSQKVHSAISNALARALAIIPATTLPESLDKIVLKLVDTCIIRFNEDKRTGKSVGDGQTSIMQNAVDNKILPKTSPGILTKIGNQLAADLGKIDELYEGKVNQAGREGLIATEADIKSVQQDKRKIGVIAVASIAALWVFFLLGVFGYFVYNKWIKQSDIHNTDKDYFLGDEGSEGVMKDDTMDTVDPLFWKFPSKS